MEQAAELRGKMVQIKSVILSLSKDQVCLGKNATELILRQG
jgi:hypothetical protein